MIEKKQKIIYRTNFLQPTKQLHFPLRKVWSTLKEEESALLVYLYYYFKHAGIAYFLTYVFFSATLGGKINARFCLVDSFCTGRVCCPRR